MRKQLPYLLLVPFLLSLPSCGSNGGTSSTGSPSESSPKSEEMSSSGNAQSSSEESPILSYVDKATPAQVYEPEVETDVNLRFYSDHPKIPYMNVRDYYSLLLDREFKVEKKDGGIFELTAFTGAKATVDVESDKLVSDDFSEFINTTIFRDEKSKNAYYDGTPYVRFSKTEANQKPLEVVFDFAKYHIDIRSDDEDVYMPFVTLSDIFKGMTMVQSFYDGKKVYVIDSNSDYSGSRYANDNTVLSNIEEAFSINGERDEDLSEFNYNELCFNFDHFYGLPGREVLHDDLIRYGLDKALEIHSPSSRVAKAYLKSTNADEYLAGIALLNDFLDDGGHTVLDSGVSAYLSKVAAVDYERCLNIQTLYDRNRIKENELDKKIYTYFAVNSLRKE
ncbi:MAG: hypothetical protein II721_05965, partial [Bacilli bacterium]|nr:hypothetical protein [Bacilli bacterium]